MQLPRHFLQFAIAINPFSKPFASLETEVHIISDKPRFAAGVPRRERFSAILSFLEHADPVCFPDRKKPAGGRRREIRSTPLQNLIACRAWFYYIRAR
jgi:hypothetical protein